MFANSRDLWCQRARQLARRPREHPRAWRPKVKLKPEKHQQLLWEFVKACAEGDAGALFGTDEKCPLIFLTAGCNPKLDFLDCLKAVLGRAERAKLKKENFWLHKFRTTFATRCLWPGVDLGTVQLWLGHTDIESTMR